MNKTQEFPPADQRNQVNNSVSVNHDNVFGLKFILNTGEAKNFTSLPITIGRGDQNDIVINDETISAVHARVYFDELIREVCILDNDSLNGILVNECPTYRNVLQDGVQLRLGRVSITFRDTGYIHSVS